jgi:tetraacyldisaccharide 4'-kinase
VTGLATRAASTLWSTLSWGARLAAQAGVLKPQRLDAGRVVSIGNIQIGGAGKTPLVAKLAREGLGRGQKVCILCRGYRSRWEIQGGILEPRVLANALECGDEAALLHELAPGAWIAVGADRAKQYAAAVTRSGGPFDLVILDDGFQHWKLRRDLDVVALTSRSPSDTLFRDFSAALGAAGLLVWTKGETAPAVPPELPLIRARFTLAPASGEKILLVTGVGDPDATLETVSRAGYKIERHVPFRDHARYDRERVSDLLAQARRAGQRVALTGKDWVKWRALGVDASDVRILEPEIELDPSAQETWNRVIWGSERKRAPLEGSP